MSRVRLIIRRRPLPGGMQHAENAHRIANHVINRDVIRVDHQLARTDDTTRSAEVRMGG